MLLDTEVLRSYRVRGKVNLVGCPTQLELDVSKIPPIQAASKIMKHFALVTEEPEAGG